MDGGRKEKANIVASLVFVMVKELAPCVGDFSLKPRAGKAMTFTAHLSGL